MEKPKSRLKSLFPDIHGEVLLNLQHDDIMKACQLEEFDSICNNEYFWQRYAKEWNYPKIAKSWKTSVKAGPMMDFLYNFGPNYKSEYGILSYKESDIKYILDNFNANTEEDLKRLEYYKNKDYNIESAITYKKVNSFHPNEPYSTLKPYSEYLDGEKSIVPYQKVILQQDTVSLYIPDPEELPANREIKDVPRLIRPGVRRTKEVMDRLLPPLPSRSYIIFDSFSKIIIDSQIKGSPLTMDDILFASRGFMMELNSKIENYTIIDENENTITLQVEVSGNPKE